MLLGLIHFTLIVDKYLLGKNILHSHFDTFAELRLNGILL